MSKREAYELALSSVIEWEHENAPGVGRIGSEVWRAADIRAYVAELEARIAKVTIGRSVAEAERDALKERVEVMREDKAVAQEGWNRANQRVGVLREKIKSSPIIEVGVKNNLSGEVEYFQVYAVPVEQEGEG